MGRVYAAYDEKLDRRVAIKVLHQEVDESSRTRVLREAQAMAKLSHPNVVPVFEVGDDPGGPYIAMELVEGKPLSLWQRDRPWRDVLDVYLQAGAGLAAAHAVGLIHRDFKPQNVMVESREPPRARVLDFGIVQVGETFEPSHDSASGGALDPSDDRLTRPGAMLGTPAYMAPEQYVGSAVTEAADQFSFCVSVWEGLHGQRPFTGSSFGELMDEVMGGKAKLPDRTDVPGWVHAILRRGLSAKIGDRYPSMSALLAELAHDPAAQRQGLLRLGFAGAALVATGVGAWVAGAANDDRCDELPGVEWSSEHRDTVRSAIEATAVPFAADVSARAMGDLDAFADAFQAASAAACRAVPKRSAALAERSEVCLARVSAEFDMVTDALADADPGVLERAASLVDGLPRPSRCNDVESLSSDVEPPPPGEKAAVERVRTDIQAVFVAKRAGKVELAQDRMESVRTQVDGLSYGPIHAEVALATAAVRLLEGDWEAAVAATRTSLEQAARHDDRGTMQVAAAQLLQVLGFRLHRYDEALAYREVAFGFAKGPSDAFRAHVGLGLTMQASGDFKTGEEHIRLALAEQREQYPDASMQVLNARHALAIVLRAGGKLEQARAELESLLETERVVLGAEHPDTINTTGTLANVEVSLGNHESALILARSMLDAKRERHGEVHSDVAVAHNAVGAALLAGGKLDEAFKAFENAVTIGGKTLGETHPTVLGARGNQLGVLFKQGKLAEAEQQLRVMIPPMVETFGPGHPSVTSMRQNLGLVLLNQDKFEDAESVMREVLASATQTMGEDHPQVARWRSDLARVLLELDRADEALPLAKASWARYEAGGGSPYEQGVSALVLARVHAAQGNGADARTLATRAKALFSSDAEPDEESLAEVGKLLDGF
jgi:serine/threonine-protein kinase